MKNILFGLVGMLITGAATAKLPALLDDAKAKAAETQAKTVHGAKVAAYRLCQSQDKVALKFADKARAAAPVPCADPGQFMPNSTGAPVPAAPTK